MGDQHSLNSTNLSPVKVSVSSASGESRFLRGCYCTGVIVSSIHLRIALRFDYEKRSRH